MTLVAGGLGKEGCAARCPKLHSLTVGASCCQRAGSAPRATRIATNVAWVIVSGGGAGWKGGLARGTVHPRRTQLSVCAHNETARRQCARRARSSNGDDDMWNHLRTLVATVAATLALALCASGAGAESGISFAVSESSSIFRSLTFEANGTEVICEFAIALTLHESTAKVAGTLMGQALVAVNTGECEGGDAGLYSGRERVRGYQGPYHVQYSSFAGTLPNITQLTFLVVGPRLWIELGGTALCNSNNTLQFSTSGGNPALGLFINMGGLRLEGGFLCGFLTGSAIGNGPLETAIGMTLV